MLSLIVPFGAFLAHASAQTHYTFGPSWGMRSSRGAGYITSLDITLVANKPPSPAAPLLAIWPGMDVPGGGLIQPIIVSNPENGRIYPG
jgi:hypothetical protein